MRAAPQPLRRGETFQPREVRVLCRSRLSHRYLSACSCLSSPQNSPLPPSAPGQIPARVSLPSVRGQQSESSRETAHPGSAGRGEGHPSAEERRGSPPAACSYRRPHLPTPGGEGRVGVERGALVTPRSLLPQAASGAAHILLPLAASRCVRGGRRRRGGKGEARREPGPPGRERGGGGGRSPQPLCAARSPPPPLYGSSCSAAELLPSSSSAPVLSEEGGVGEKCFISRGC